MDSKEIARLVDRLHSDKARLRFGAGRKLRLATRLFDRTKFRLVSQGFHWIHERPFNR